MHIHSLTSMFWRKLALVIRTHCQQSVPCRTKQEKIVSYLLLHCLCLCVSVYCQFLKTHVEVTSLLQCIIHRWQDLQYKISVSVSLCTVNTSKGYIIAAMYVHVHTVYIRIYTAETCNIKSLHHCCNVHVCTCIYIHCTCTQMAIIIKLFCVCLCVSVYCKYLKTNIEVTSWIKFLFFFAFLYQCLSIIQ